MKDSQPPQVPSSRIPYQLPPAAGVRFCVEMLVAWRGHVTYQTSHAFLISSDAACCNYEEGEGSFSPPICRPECGPVFAHNQSMGPRSLSALRNTRFASPLPLSFKVCQLVPELVRLLDDCVTFPHLNSTNSWVVVCQSAINDFSQVELLRKGRLRGWKGGREGGREGGST